MSINKMPRNSLFLYLMKYLLSDARYPIKFTIRRAIKYDITLRINFSSQKYLFAEEISAQS